jgi:branched-chain amino acid transport system ATP-binding protein
MLTDSNQIIISTHNLNKKFGGIVVAKNVNFSVNKGEFRCLIGPNGAGKSTLFSLLCGIEKADSGQITILNKNVTELKAFQRIKLGLGLKFQTNKAFQSLSIKDNLSISDNNFDIKKNKIAEERYQLALTEFGLKSEENKQAGELPHNMLQWLEITMILASFPKIVLLDEPTAGMSVEETLFTGSVLKRLNATGLTIIVVEHDMQFVKDVANKITVLHEGEIFSEGTAEEVSNSEEVKNIYLGRD